MGEFDSYLDDCEKLLYTTEGTAEYLGFTNSRVIYLGFKGLFGQKKQFKDIRYSHISSLVFTFSSNLLILIAGIALFIFAFILSTEIAEMMMWIIIPGLVLVVVYFFTRKTTIIFVTEQEKIPFRFKGTEALDMATTISKIVRKYE